MKNELKALIIFSSFLVALGTLGGLMGCQSEQATKPEVVQKVKPLSLISADARTNLRLAKLGPLKDVPLPDDNPLTKEKADLGKMLFFDVRLGGDGKTSCASCHNPEKAWCDNQPKSRGVRNRRGLRNTPTLLNVAYYKTLCWDGHVSGLEQQVLEALGNRYEMASTPQHVVRALSSIAGYGPLFKAAFGDQEVTAERIAKAVASFERTLVTGPSAFDRFLGGEAKALTSEQIEGLSLFLTSGKCVGCHKSAFFTSQEFTPSGIYIKPDFGRYNWTKKDYDYGKFRVPSLRNVALTAPYFHNGSESSLVEAAFFRIHGRTKEALEKKGIDPRMVRGHLPDNEIKYIAAFLEALSGELPEVEVPQQFPQ